jgi:hypothetical protein
MELHYVKLGSTILYYNGTTQTAKIDQQVNGESEYPRRYKITVEDGSIINVEVDAEGKWIEQNKGATAISQMIGRLIEQFHE